MRMQPPANFTNFDEKNPSHFVARDVPQKLYKYSGISRYTFETFINRQIYFSCPLDFNDPFDCYIPIRYDQMNPEEWKEFHIVAIMETQGFSREVAEKIFYDKRIYEMTPDTDLMTAERLEKVSNLRVFCVSPTKSNFLMWSHYGLKHTGICIGYSTNHLCVNTESFVRKVEYASDMPEIKPEVGYTDLFKQILYKSKCWEYEDEFRIVALEEKYLFDFEANAIIDVTFGCKCSDSDIKSIVTLIKNNLAFSHVKFFKMHQKKFSFELEERDLE